MKRIILSLVAIVAVGLLTGVQIRAHHAFAAEFDANRPVKIEGTIARVEWTNPHVWFHIDVKNPQGQVERWMFEGGGPGSLVRRGFSKDHVKVGTEMVVQGYMAKGVARRANARVMTYKDGRTLFVGSSGTGAPQDGTDPTEPRR
jgi:hypothetical protein